MTYGLRISLCNAWTVPTRGAYCILARRHMHFVLKLSRRTRGTSGHGYHSVRTIPSGAASRAVALRLSNIGLPLARWTVLACVKDGRVRVPIFSCLARRTLRLSHGVRIVTSGALHTTTRGCVAKTPQWTVVAIIVTRCLCCGIYVGRSRVTCARKRSAGVAVSPQRARKARRSARVGVCVQGTWLARGVRRSTDPSTTARESNVAQACCTADDAV